MNDQADTTSATEVEKPFVGFHDCPMCPSTEAELCMEDAQCIRICVECRHISGYGYGMETFIELSKSMGLQVVMPESDPDGYMTGPAQPAACEKARDMGA